MQTPDPLGPHPDQMLRAITDTCSTIVAAWGTRGSFHNRDKHAIALYEEMGVQLQCLGTTKDGHHLHPLYIPAEAKLRPFPVREAVTP